MYKNKKLISIFILTIIFSIISPVFASTMIQNDEMITDIRDFGNYMFKPEIDSAIKSIDTVADIDETGNMKVRQRWIFNDKNSDNTEHFIVFSKSGLKDVDIVDAVVYQNDKPLKMVDWNVDEGFQEKAGKFGWNITDDNIELCFGIGDKIENNTFVVEYTVKRALFNSNDGYTFLNWQFINNNLSDTVGKIRTEIQFPGKVKKMYGFGYKGYVALSSEYKNAVVLETDSGSGYGYSNRMVALVELEDKYPNLRTEDRNRLKIYKTSFEGSDYDIEHLDDVNPLLTEDYIIKSVQKDENFSNSLTIKPEKFPKGIFFVGILHAMMPFILVIVVLVFGFSASKKTFNMDRSNLNEFIWRDKPDWEPNDVIPVLIQSSLVMFPDIVNYYMVKWVKEDKIIVLHEEEPGILWFNKTRDTIVFKDQLPPRNQLERVVYDFIYSHAENGEITTTQLSKMRWDRITNYFDNVYYTSDEYMSILERCGTVKKWGVLRKYYDPNEEGQEIYRQYRGLRNFLIEFTKMDERQIRDVKIWDYHLEMAALFGIADEVQAQLKLYPEVFQTDPNSGINPVYVSRSFGNITSSIQSSMSSGSGGSSSHCGGGGSSGGGSGGGSR